MEMGDAIQCRNCRWIYFKYPHWQCSCGISINPFENNTNACPHCNLVWSSIQCPKCAFPLSKEEWEGITPNTPVERSKNILKMGVYGYTKASDPES